jgi:hypothetical protein
MKHVEWGAWILWCEAYWTDERESEYRRNRHRFGFHQQVDLRPQTPPIPNRQERLVEIAQVIGQVEAGWGKTFRDVMRDIFPAMSWEHPDYDKELSRIVYRALMSSIGSGVAPGDEREWELTGLPDTVGFYWENPFYGDMFESEHRPIRTHKNPFPEGYLSLFAEVSV